MRRFRKLGERLAVRRVGGLSASRSVPKTPLSTYRVQLRSEFGFDEAAAIAGYLADLGVSHLYSSPYLQAARGSTHGYDVVDPTRVNEELGGEEAHARLCRALGETGLGQVLDIVPNHMAITETAQHLVVGRAGERRRQPLRRLLRRRLALARRRGCATRCCCRSWATTTGGCWRPASWSWCAGSGRFEIHYHEHRMPVAPRSLDALIAEAARRCGSPDLAFIADSLGQLPLATATDRESIARRHRDKEVLAGQLARLAEERPEVAAGAGRGRRRRSTPTPTGSTSCSSARTTASPSGAPPGRSSTTGASSTSTP